jgi:hypothetical protein
MPYSLSDDMKLIQIQHRIDNLLVLMKDHLKDATPTQIQCIRREISNLVTQRFNEMKKTT